MILAFKLLVVPAHATNALRAKLRTLTNDLAQEHATNNGDTTVAQCLGLIDGQALLIEAPLVVITRQYLGFRAKRHWT